VCQPSRSYSDSHLSIPLKKSGLVYFKTTDRIEFKSTTLETPDRT
jgi:hypothetical protein